MHRVFPPAAALVLLLTLGAAPRGAGTAYLAEIDHLDSWQNSVLAAVTVSNDRVHAEQILHSVEAYAASMLGGALAGGNVEWIS